MVEDFPKPPSWSIWLLALVSAAGLGSALFGFPALAPWFAMLGLLATAWPISNWLGRVAGWFFRELGRGMGEGWREGVERSRRERAEQQARQRR